MRKKEKDYAYYRELIRCDAIVILLVSIIFTILGLFFISKKGSEDFIPIVLKSIIFVLFESIILINKESQTKTIGLFALITSIFMLLTSIIDRSLFGIVYLIFGIIYAFHSVKYLIKLKDVNIDDSKLSSNIKYITLLPNILSILFVFGLIQDDIKYRIIIFGSLIVINIINAFICTRYNHKYKGSILIYFTLVVSIISILINSIFLIDDVGNIIYKNVKKNSQSYVSDICQNLEKSINRNIVTLENLTTLNVRINEDAVVQLDDSLDVANGSDIVALKELKEKGYVCDGYTILSWKQNLDITDYRDVSNKLSYPYNMSNYFSKIETYIKCSGKYSYQTKGFDNALLK